MHITKPSLRSSRDPRVADRGRIQGLFGVAGRLFALALFTAGFFSLSVCAQAEEPLFPELAADEKITVDELRQLQVSNEPVVLLDARAQKTYAESHILGAVLPYDDEFYRVGEMFRLGIVGTPPEADPALVKGMEKYPKNAKIVTYCNSNCKSSAKLLFRLKRLGYTDVRAMEEGIDGWKAKGYPVSEEKQI